MQLTTEVNFISLKAGSDETRIMYTRSNNIEIMFGDDNDDIIEQLFESLLKKYEENSQNKMRGSELEFDGVNFLYYDFNKTSINRGGSYIDSSKWLKDKKSTINHKNNYDKCFQYAVTLALNLDKIKKDPQRVSKIKPFIKKYSWEDIDFPSTSKDWKKFECNNEVALNILYVPYNTKKLNIAYKSKNNLTHKRQIILLMISDGQKWHYLVVKNLSGLLRGITSNHKEDFYCLNCFHSYRTENKLESHKKICENHDYCHVEMPTKDNNIIKYNNGEKSMKVPFIIYADLECLLEKMSTCINNPNESSTTKINNHTSSGYSIFTHCSFDKSKNKLNYYRGKDCMKKFCKDLKEHATRIINHEKKKIIPLTTEEKIYHNKQKICYICKKEYRVIEFNQEAWLKPYIDMNTELRKLVKNGSEKDLFKLMNNSVFGKTKENIRKHRDIKLVTIDKKRSKLVSEPNYHTINLITEDLSIIEMKNTKVKMNKPIYLGLSILEISKTLMYEFWYDYMKPKYNGNVKLCYMDTDSFVMNIKTNDFYKDIASDVENRFDTSNYEVKRPLPTGKNIKVIGLMKDELGGKIITEFVTLRPKTYSFLTDDGKEDKKTKGTKKCIIKKMIKFNDYKKCLLDDEVILKSQKRFVSKKHDVYTENINKIALSNNDDKRIVSSNKISSYPYGYFLNN